MFKNAQSLCSKIIHMLSNFFEPPQFSVEGNIYIGSIAWDHT